MKIISTILFFFLLCHVCGAQSLAINTDGSNANSSAILDVKSITKGLLIPRMNKAQRIAIATPANGLLVYQNAPDSTGFYFYDGSVWVWLSNPNPTNAWNINGNSGTDVFTNYVGTNDNTDLAFRINGFERMRLTGEAALGIGSFVPKYPLDINYGQAGINNCPNNGIRIKSVGLNSVDCDKGLLLGYTDPSNLSNDAVLWNFGQSSGGVKNIIFGLTGFERMRLNSNGFLGLGSILPNYTLDVGTGSAGVNPCVRNGLRLDVTSPFWECDRGLFMGFDDGVDNRSTSIWNFGDINNPATNLYLRFGFGNQFSGAGQGGEVMRILPPGKGIGIGRVDPLAMLHITNYSGGPALPGLMVTRPGLPPNSSGFYTGLRFTGFGDDGYVWNYQDAPILFGTNDILRMELRENGNFVFGNPSPVYRSPHAYFNVDTVHLDKDLNVSGESFFADTVTVGSAIATPTRLHVFGETVTDELQVTTLAAPGKVLTSDLIGNATWEDPVNYWTLNANDLYNNNTGNTGIGVNNPAFKLDVGARMRIRSTAGNTAGLWLNNDANTATPSFIGMRNDSLVGFYGSAAPNSGWGMLMNTNSGRVGIGTDNAAAALHVIGNIIASGTITPSDLRFKTNIRPIHQPLQKLLSLNGVSYLMNSTAFPQMQFDNDMQYGLIAQEVEKVFPEMVKKITADGYKGIDYVKLVPVLIEGLKALNEKIDQQQKEIELLKKEK